MKRKFFLPLIAVIMLLFSVQVSAANAPKTEKIIYGTSGEGRELVAYRYGSGKNVLVVGFALHGFEDNFDRDGEALVYTAQQVMAHLEGSYLPNSRNWTVYILPCMNPDGVYSGWTNNGPGRCTTTYLSNGKLVKGSGKGVDMNRCFPTRFSAMYSSRNYTTSQSMACLEAQALSNFIQKVKGDKVNVLIDVHGWLQQTITTSSRISTVLNKNFPNNTRTYSNGGTGYLITYAHDLGYESALLELPYNNYSMSQYKSSGCVNKIIACVDGLICSEPCVCDQSGHDYTTETTAATCSTNGKTVKTCKNCGDSTTTTIRATGHKFTITTTAATCTTNGKTVKACQNCGGSITTPIAATGHDFTIKTTAATCSTNGETVKTCKNCGSIITSTIRATGHKFTITTTAATCTTNGKTVKACQNCGGSITTPIAATGHSYETVTVLAAACTEDGCETKVCAKCSTQTVVKIPAAGHTVETDSVVVIAPPTASKNGLQSYTCSACGEENLVGEIRSIFSDVSGDTFYSDSLDWSYENLYFRGIKSDLFGPDIPLSRAMLVTILYRYHGSPEAEPESVFVDVPTDAYYADPVSWAWQNGIVDGVGESRFAPDDPVTRQQTMAIFFRYVQYLERDNGLRSDMAFPDLGDLHSYATEAAAWSVANGIIYGYQNGNLMPDASATRAQSAVILYRLDEYLNSESIAKE